MLNYSDAGGIYDIIQDQCFLIKFHLFKDWKLVLAFQTPSSVEVRKIPFKDVEAVSLHSQLNDANVFEFYGFFRPRK